MARTRRAPPRIQQRRGARRPPLPSLPTRSRPPLIITPFLLLPLVLVVIFLQPTTTIAAVSLPSSKLWGARNRLPRPLHTARGGGVGPGKSSSSSSRRRSSSPPPSPPPPTKQRKTEEEEGEQAETTFFTIGDRFQSVATKQHYLQEEDEEQDEEDEEEEGEEGKKQAARRTQRTQKQAFAEEEEMYTALQYGVVAIVGPQASGKSTLLNALFGTRFPVLDVGDAGAGRRTTRGVWVDLGGERGSSSSSSGSSNSVIPQPLVVLDTEGLESVARGEGSHLFDRQLSALAVTAADVIILNVWARDIRGGRMGGELHAALLQTLVQRTTTVTTRSTSVRLSEGGGEKKKKEGKEEGKEGGGITITTTTTKRRRTLLVVLRDSERPEGDVAGARGIVTRCLEEAYAALGRAPPSPPPSSSSPPSATAKVKKWKKKEAEEGGLDVRVVALPSKEFQPVEFGEAVNELRRTLLLFDHDSATEAAAADSKTKTMRKSPSSPSSSRKLLQPVPLLQFPSFAAELWASIVQGSAGGMVGDSPSSPPSSSSSSGEEEIQAFIRRKVVESCVSEAEKQIERLERKVEAAASEMPILEYGRDADSIITTALKSLRARPPFSAATALSATAAAEEEVIAFLTRRLAPSFRQHLDALHEFYFAKFQDRFIGLFLPLRALDKEAKSLTKDVSTAFQKAAQTAVPPSAAGGMKKGGRQGWESEGALERLRDEMDLEVADRRMEVEVLFPGEEELEMSKSRFLRKSWWKKVVLKAAVLYINYLQTVQAAQGMARAARRRQEKYPPIPMF